MYVCYTQLVAIFNKYLYQLVGNGSETRFSVITAQASKQTNELESKT